MIPHRYLSHIPSRDVGCVSSDVTHSMERCVLSEVVDQRRPWLVVSWKYKIKPSRSSVLQYRILPKFPKLCMKSWKFWSMGAEEGPSASPRSANAFCYGSLSLLHSRFRISGVCLHRFISNAWMAEYWTDNIEIAGSNPTHDSFCCLKFSRKPFMWPMKGQTNSIWFSNHFHSVVKVSTDNISFFHLTIFHPN